MRYFSLALLALAVIVSMASFNRAEANKMSKEPIQPKIQMAILLDTSGSMEGLINQAKEQLWTIVKELSKYHKNDQEPIIEVALYEYGKSSIDKSEHYIQQLLPLTTNLDKVSEELFKLRTNGGDEYCGQVIHNAVKNLEWSDNPDDLRLIYIAGNEPFTQGGYAYSLACKEAREKNIIVNTIHCGSRDQGVTGKWEDGALLGKGKFLNIDHNQDIVQIKTPYDKKLNELSTRLNKTYIGFGKKAPEAADRQRAADKNAEGLGAANAAERAEVKAKSQYDNSSWDLVDNLDKGNKLEEIEEEALPAEMQKMNMAERKAFVEGKAKERKAIQQEITELAKKRNAFMAKEREKLAEAGEKTLDSAMIEAARLQAETNDFQIKE